MVSANFFLVQTNELLIYDVKSYFNTKIKPSGFGFIPKQHVPYLDMTNYLMYIIDLHPLQPLPFFLIILDSS